MVFEFSYRKTPNYAKLSKAAARMRPVLGDNLGQQDGNTKTCSFVTPPEIATAFLYASQMYFNLATDIIHIKGSIYGLRFAPVKVKLPLAFTTVNTCISRL